MKTRLQRLAAVVLLVLGQFSAGLSLVPSRAFADTPDITEYAIPTADAGPGGLVAGPDGALWFSETGSNKIGRITTSGSITEYNIPTADSRPQAIVSGPQGALWFTELFGKKIGRITTSGVVTEFALPAVNTLPSRLAYGSDGNLWFSSRTTVNGTDGYAIMRMTPSGTFTQFPVTPFGILTSITDIQSGQDGALWFAVNAQTSGNCATKINQIGRMTTTGAVTYFQLPTRCNAPLRLTVGFDGAWWFTESASNTGTFSMGRFKSPSTTTDYPIATPGALPIEISRGSDGAVWFTENAGNKVGRIAVDGTITEYPLANGVFPSVITAGPDNNMWFASADTNKFYKLTVPSEPTFSNDLAYIKFRPSGGSSMIESVDLESNNSPATLTSTSAFSRPFGLSFNPDRTRLYYGYLQTATPALMLRPGSQLEGIAALRCESPSVSPDGKRLACFDLIGGERRIKIVSLRTYQETIVEVPGVDGGQLSPILQPRIDWLTDSSLVINLSYVNCSAARIARINTDGTGFASLTGTTCNGPGAVGGRVSSDGSKIAYFNNDGIYVMNADGSSPALLATPEAGMVFSYPAWSTDDKYVSATVYDPANSSQNSRVVVINAQTGSVVKTLLQQGEYVFGETDWVGTYTPPDSTPPTVTGTADRQPNTAGWYDGNVTITWSAIDPVPSSGAPTTPQPTVADQEGTHTYTSEESCDPADNCATGSTTLKIDKSSPTINFSLSAAPNSAGWHKGDVVVTFECDDAVSDVASCSEPVTVGEGANQTVTGTATDLGGNTATIQVVLNVDKTKPAIAYVMSPAAPNSAGWFKSDVAIDFECLDELSGIESCSQPVTISTEAAGQTAIGTATDVADNEQSITIDNINIDKTAPGVGSPSWSVNPKSVYQSSTLSVPATDEVSGVASGEYFIGDTDPGLGNGVAMTLSGASLTTSFGTNLQPGVYKVSFRAHDVAGNWSATASDYLVVYDPLGFSITGKRTIVPSKASGDILPGLINNDQDDKAKFAFNVKYNNQGVVANNSDMRFDYSTGTKCNNPNQAQNCHDLKLNATGIEWLVVQGANSSEGVFQGLATLTVDGVTTSNPFRVTGIDGTRLNPTADDHVVIKLYAPGANPNSAVPLYQVSQDILRGNIRIRE